MSSDRLFCVTFIALNKMQTTIDSINKKCIKNISAYTRYSWAFNFAVKANKNLTLSEILVKV
jgi:hypothetical protein